MKVAEGVEKTSLRSSRALAAADRSISAEQAGGSAGTRVGRLVTDGGSIPRCVVSGALLVARLGSWMVEVDAEGYREGDRL